MEPLGQPMSDPDIELMLRIREGDTVAFGELFDRHGRGLFGFFHWYGLRGDDAEDGVQEVFQRVWQAREHYEPTGRVRSWLVRIATNWLIDQGRAKQRRPSVRSLDAPIDGADPGAGRMLDRIDGVAR